MEDVFICCLYLSLNARRLYLRQQCTAATKKPNLCQGNIRAVEYMDSTTDCGSSFAAGYYIHTSKSAFVQGGGSLWG